MQKITTFLWYENQAEEAAKHYTSIFDDSEITSVSRYSDAGPGALGSVMTVTFRLAGQQFIALNGHSRSGFTESISLFVDCTSQREVDELWRKLSDGGEQGPCGWLTDRYGVSWQIIPRALTDLASDPDPEKAGRVMKAMLGMGKIDIKALEDAYHG
ncbi:MAG: VOC family protein [Micromonosporaceae bacterium]